MSTPLTVSLSGSDTLLINNQVISTLADEDPCVITFPNEIVNVAQGKNATVIYAQNNMGYIADMMVRLTLGGIDDEYLNAILNQQTTAFSDMTLMTAVFTKRVGQGNGSIASVIYQLTGGVFSKGIEALTSARGETKQGIAVYPIRFGNWVRLIQ